ncbi:MAG: hypothetical protein OXB96_01790 [Candidatus Kaiserbacteria bacterium]|nr:hypothetical protein [Candidatus Kaiserbacteria bacterium]
MTFLKRIATFAATFAVVLALTAPTFAVDGVSFGTTATEETAEAAEAAQADEKSGNGVNDIDVDYKSEIKFEEGAIGTFEGTKDAAKTIAAINDPAIKRYALQGIVYSQGQMSVENAYRELQDGDRKAINAAISSNDKIVRALTIAASDATLPLAKVDRILQSIEGYAMANTYLLAKLGTTKVVSNEGGTTPNPFNEGNGLDLAHVIVFAGLVILAWIAGNRVLAWAKVQKEKLAAKKKAKEAEETAAKDALREKRARETGGTSRNRNRNRNRNRGAEEAATSEVVEA